VANLNVSEICDEIVKSIKAEKGPESEIEVKGNAAYFTIKFWGIHSLRVRCGKKNHIWLKNSFEHIWTNYEFVKIERLKSEELWSRTPFQSLEELKGLRPLFLQIYDEAFFQVNLELFSCCSRFIQCSDEKACTQPDKRLALGCQYGKHLKNGRIFYGKNCNVVREF